MRVRLYLDEDVDLSLAHVLRQKGIDALATQEAGRRRLTDAEQLDFAAGDKRAIVTHNKRDFVLLHKSYVLDGRNHHGIILSDQRTLGEMLRGLSRLVFTLRAEEMENRLEFLGRWI